MLECGYEFYEIIRLCRATDRRIGGGIGGIIFRYRPAERTVDGAVGSNYGFIRCLLGRYFAGKSSIDAED
jgi:hypothetical protein